MAELSRFQRTPCETAATTKQAREDFSSRACFCPLRTVRKALIKFYSTSSIPSGAKARIDFADSIGTTEVVP
jgi:hypothetical protein